MSVWSVTIAEAAKPWITECYCVEADDFFDACRFAIGAHAMEEKESPENYEVVAVGKVAFRHVLTAEIVPTLPA